MIKVIDIDSLFDSYISDYVYQNVGKINPEEIENKMPILYEEFGDKALAELDGKTPNTFYKEYSATELLDCLKQHIEQGVSVSDFLCEAIISNQNGEDALIESLSKDNDEEYTLYLMNILSEMGSTKYYHRLLEFILWDYSEPIRELATELLGTGVNQVKEQIISQFNEVDEVKKACLTDVLSNAEKDDRIFNILTLEFAKHQENVPLYASYLAKYGDERALPFLMQAIENPKIKYSDFEELRFAIEALGGEYDKLRDFSNDKSYKIIKGGKKFQS